MHRMSDTLQVARKMLQMVHLDDLQIDSDASGGKRRGLLHEREKKEAPFSLPLSSSLWMFVCV